MAIEVKLVAKTDVDFKRLASKAAFTCYEATEPTGDKTINLEKKIWPTGHHTVIQHSSFTFFIEGIPIGNITLGLHLAMIFYVSSQRSGRFCFGMFSEPTAIESILQHIREFYPATTANQHHWIKSYIQYCQKLYSANVEPGTQIAAQWIREERPHASEQYIEQNAKKFAQEQLRMMVPVIFPTAVEFTINFSALAALYRTAWDPVMLYLTEQMAQQVLALDPSLAFAFQRQTNSLETESKLTIPKSAIITWDNHPALTLRSMDDLSTAIYPDFDDLHPIDTLYFAPKFMPNNDIYIKTLVHISLATMGQDQRHRRINRGLPQFTGYIYCPPIAEELGLSKALAMIGREWVKLSEEGIHPALTQTLAPYGAMVEYTKSGDLNGVLHEQGKRLCWCAQQEIYEISNRLREDISNHPGTEKLLPQLAPPCYKSGVCSEGARYCGRDLTIDRAHYFPMRKV